MSDQGRSSGSAACQHKLNDETLRIMSALPPCCVDFQFSLVTLNWHAKVVGPNWSGAAVPKRYCALRTVPVGRGPRKLALKRYTGTGGECIRKADRAA